MTDLTDLDLVAASEGLAQARFRAADLTAAYLDRIADRDRDLNCYVTVTAAAAEKAAEECDRRAKRLGPLDGIPIALKDNIDLADTITGNGLGPRNRAPAAVDASVVARLKAAGAVILGKLNMHEAALGATTDNPHTGRTENPWAPGFTPGGSSGGSAAAVAAHLCCASLGTDTMGSVRVPAAYCGVVGIKPTFGVVSTNGVAPLSWRLDHVGPLARSVRDCAVMLDGMIGYDPAWPGARPAPPPGPAGDWRHFTIARLGPLGPLDAAVGDGFSRALETLEAMGLAVGEAVLPDYELSAMRRNGLLVTEAEGAVALADEQSRDPGAFSAELSGFLDYGRTLSVPRLVAAERSIEVFSHTFRRLFDDVDILVLPVAPQTAFPFADPVPVNQADLTAAANFAGCPALSVPSGLTTNGLPLALQMVAAPHCEADLIHMAKAFEAAAGFEAL